MTARPPPGPVTAPPPACLCRLTSRCAAPATLACLQWLPGRSSRSSSVKGQMVDILGGVVCGCSASGTTETCVPRNPSVLGKRARLVTPLCRPSGLCCSCSALPLKRCSSWKREETEGAWLWAHKASFMKSSGRAEGFAAPGSKAPVSLPPQGLHTCLSRSSLKYAPTPLLSCPLLRAHGSQAPGCRALAAENRQLPPSPEECPQAKGAASPGSLCSAFLTMAAPEGPSVTPAPCILIGSPSRPHPALLTVPSRCFIVFAALHTILSDLGCTFVYWSVVCLALECRDHEARLPCSSPGGSRAGPTAGSPSESVVLMDVVTTG